ncbi:MAG: capsule assembly Wzi family protein [Candidatus Neomarinimicrobiota bacterium]
MLNPFTKNNIQKNSILLLVLFTKLYSQDFHNQYSLELNSYLSNQWWSQYNSYGQEPSKMKFDYNGMYQKNGVDYHLSISASEDRTYIGESFIKSKIYNNIYIKAGRYYKDFSVYLNNNISSGSILISNNAQPMPKIGLLSSYKLKRNKSIHFTLGIAHGLFEKNKVYKNAPMLHEKFLYLNYIKDNNEFSSGFVHEAMWGGSTEEYGDFPSSFKDFLKVFISADGPLLEGEPHSNALGNHLGIWDFYYKRITEDKILKIYYQHFFEDTSGLRFSNRIDGLWGVELENYIPKTHFLIEYLQTTDQDRTRHNDAYYNHYQYSLGWSYKGHTLGNPFINHLEVLPVKVFHLGVSGEIYSNYHYRLKVARKINVSDKAKYELLLTKKFDKKNQMSISDLSVYILNNEDMKNGIGVRISYRL